MSHDPKERNYDEKESEVLVQEGTERKVSDANVWEMARGYD